MKTRTDIPGNASLPDNSESKSEALGREHEINLLFMKRFAHEVCFTAFIQRTNGDAGNKSTKKAAQAFVA